MTFRLLVTGREGQVARTLVARGQTDGVEIISVARPQFDLLRNERFDDIIQAVRPDAIVSAAAYTSVDLAESEPELAEAMNGRAPGELGKAAAKMGIPVIHLSTDYVFSGDKAAPYVESDATGPLNVYGRTKLEGERMLALSTSNYVILRTSWVYSPHGRNFVKTMLSLADDRDVLNVVSDQWGCPTSADDIARIVIAVARRLREDESPHLRGVFHMAGRGEGTSWAGFAEAIFERSRVRGGPAALVNPVLSSSWPTPAQRPKNSRLDCGRLLQHYGLSLDLWRRSLDKCLDKVINSKEA